MLSAFSHITCCALLSAFSHITSSTPWCPCLTWGREGTLSALGEGREVGELVWEGLWWLSWTGEHPGTEKKSRNAPPYAPHDHHHSLCLGEWLGNAVFGSLGALTQVWCMVLTLFVLWEPKLTPWTLLGDGFLRFLYQNFDPVPQTSVYAKHNPFPWAKHCTFFCTINNFQVRAVLGSPRSVKAPPDAVPRALPDPDALSPKQNLLVSLFLAAHKGGV